MNEFFTVKKVKKKKINWHDLLLKNSTNNSDVLRSVIFVGYSKVKVAEKSKYEVRIRCS